MLRLSLLGCALLLATAGCAPSKSDPACLHYGSSRRATEGAPECDFRSTHTLINGLPAAHNWNAP